MYTTVLASSLVLTLVMCLLSGCLAAPSVSRQERSLSDHHGHRNRETKLSLVLSNEEDPSLDAAAGRLSETLFGNRRSKRDVTSSSTATASEAIDLLLPGESSISPSERRHRRSAAWWMHAVIQMCNNNRQRCRRIEVEEGSLHMRIRLEDM